MGLKEDINKDPDKVLSDENKLKEIMKDGKLVSFLLEKKDLVELEVEIDGEPVLFINAPNPPFPPY